MSSSAECLVITAALDRAELDRALDRVIQHLQRSGVLGGREPGDERAYRPGPNAHGAVAADDASALGLARSCVVRLGDGALGRGVFGAGESTGDGMRCPRCDRPFDLAEGSFGEAIDDWWRGGAGELACEGCGARSAITTWPADNPIGLGYACLEWQDWPPLDEAFVATLEDAIGHPIVLVHQHF